jgi:hypothetical protein
MVLNTNVSSVTWLLLLARVWQYSTSEFRLSIEPASREVHQTGTVVSE